MTTNAISSTADATNMATVTESPQPSDSARGEAVDQRDQAQGGQQDAGDVERVAVAAALRLTDDEVRAERGHDRERDVHEEGPAPVHVLGQHTAEDEAHGTATTGDGAVDAERLGALLGVREHHGEQGERGGREQGAEDTLEGAGAEHHGAGGRGTAERGGRGEADQADDEGVLAAPQVGYAAAEEQEPAEGQGVGRHDPLPVAVGDAEVGLGRRQGDVHDGRVEDDHQLGQRDEDERFPAVGVTGRCRCAGSLCGCFRHGGTHFGTSVRKR
ncbi:hypothetical protein M2163_004577 [Streptomyces sp. SAI-135]|nr:hypothetical protein [Streptomyces sp. SAI-135]